MSNAHTITENTDFKKNHKSSILKYAHFIIVIFGQTYLFTFDLGSFKNYVTPVDKCVTSFGDES